MIKSTLSAFAALVLVSSAALVYADAPTTEPAVKPYPLKTCLISKEELGGDMGQPIVLNYKGQEMKFCCGSCVAKFKKDPEKYLKELDEASKMPATPAAPAK